MATITLTPANNADDFADKSVDEDDGQSVVQLLNSDGNAFAILEVDEDDADPPDRSKRYLQAANCV